MAKKFDKDLIIHVLSSQGLTAEQVAHAIVEMQRLTDEEKQQADGERGIRVKQKHIIAIANLPEDFNPAWASAWIVKIPEECESDETLSKLIGTARSYNASLQDNSKSLKVRNLAETMEFIPAKIFKESGISRVTKEPVDIVKADNFTIEEESIGYARMAQTQDEG